MVLFGFLHFFQVLLASLWFFSVLPVSFRFLQVFHASSWFFLVDLGLFRFF